MTYLLLGGIYLLSGFVQGFLGFGIGVIAVPLVMLLLGIKAATAVHIIVAIIICGINSWVYRHQINLPMVSAVTAVSMLFVPVGIFLRDIVPDYIVMMLMGSIVIYVAADRLKKTVRQGNRQSNLISPTQKTFTFVKAFISSAASGAMSGAFAMSGPPIIAFFYRSSVNLNHAKGNTQLYFTLISLITAGIYFRNGSLVAENVLAAMGLVPVALLSSSFGVLLSRKIPADNFNCSVVVGMFVFGAWISIKGIFQIMYTY